LEIFELVDTLSTDRTDLNVLIVDDEQTIQNLVKSVLISMGIRKIDIVSDGRAALQAVAKKTQASDAINVIICDWDMPVMDGISFVEAFRKTDEKAVIIMVTARNSTTDFNIAKQKGADYFFMKPLEANMLKIRLGGALDAAVSRI
jgi:CheY-like chemotaxis protein